MNNRFHVIKDPVHGTMQFTSIEDAWIKPFIDSPGFQRLRHIKQLGLGDYIFPGAVHTRFNHCLGCCYIASQIAHKIGLSDEERQLVMIAALLHDIGHGPFSHAFEDIFYPARIKHEDWTPSFLADYETDEFFSEFNRINPDFPLTQSKFSIIADMIMHKPQKQNVLADIVSSQLDADRLDYLLRDSHFCGVRYGEFDFRWMLHCLAIVPTKQGDRLGITHKGIGVVEHYLMARRLMLRNIYHSQKKLALECFLVDMLSSLAENLTSYPAFSAFRQTQLGMFLMAVNEFNQDANTNDLRQAQKKIFIKAHYQHYKALYDDDVFVLIRKLAPLSDHHDVVQLAQRLYYRVMPKILRLDQANVEKAELDIAEFKHKHKNQFHDWQLTFIQTPQHAYSGETDPIFVINEHGCVTTIGNYSAMLEAISDKFEHVAFLIIDAAISQDKSVLGLIKYLEANPMQSIDIGSF